MGPVTDDEGHARWRVRVAPGERTCTACGETFPEGDYCPLCGYREDGRPRVTYPPSTPTLTYLRPGEYETI